MSPEKPTGRKAVLRFEFEASHRAFHALLDALSDADFKKQSLNPSWTNGELLFHMALGFFVLASLLPLARFFGHFPKASSQPVASLLNRGTRPFNWTNALGTRLGGRVMTRRSLGKAFDWVHAHLVKSLETVHDEDWERCGMYAPTRWDAISFQEYMTLEDIFRMPLRHFAFHREQLARETRDISRATECISSVAPLVVKRARNHPFRGAPYVARIHDTNIAKETSPPWLSSQYLDQLRGQRGHVHCDASLSAPSDSPISPSR